jgi:hypothetical protein
MVRGPPVGAGLPANDVNDNACCLIKRGALETFAGKPAPTGVRWFSDVPFAGDPKVKQEQDQKIAASGSSYIDRVRTPICVAPYPL